MSNIEKYLATAIRWGLLIVPLLPLYVATDLFFPFITGKNFAFRIIIEVLFALWVVLALRHRKYLPGKSAIVWSVAALAVVLSLATVFSVDTYRSFFSNAERMEGLFGLLHVFAFFLITTSVFRKKDWLRFFWVSLGVSALVSAHGVVQLLGKAEIHQGGVRVDANLGNASYLAVYLIFHIFLALYFITRYRHRLLRWGLGALTLLNIFILFNTATRGAILGLIAGLFVTGVLVALLSKGRARRWGVAALVVAVLVPLLFLAVRDADFVRENEVLSRFATISTAEATTQARFLIWGMAFDAWKDRPVVGWGPESFTTIFAQYYRPELWRQEPWFDRAHNVFLDWLTSAGILGLLAYLSLFASAVVLLWKLYKRGPADGGLTALQASLFVGLLVAYFVHNLFVFDNLVSYAMFFAVLGYLHYRRTSGSELQAPGSEPLVSSYGWRVALSSLTALFILFSLYAYNVKPIQAAGNLLRGLSALGAVQEGDVGRIDLATREIEEGLARKTFISGEIREQLASSAQVIFSNPSVPGEKRVALMSLAVSEMEGQLERSPLDMRARMFLLFLYDESGQFEKGAELGRETVNLAPTRQLYRFLYGSILSQQGKSGEALAQFEAAFEMDPTYYEAVDFYALALLQAGDESFAQDLVEGRFAEELSKTPEFRRVYETAEAVEQGLRNYRGLSPRFARAFASIGDNMTAARIYEGLIEQNISEGEVPAADYFVQYALLKVELEERADAIAMLERMKEFYTIPQHIQEIDDFIADIRAGKTEF